MNLFVVGDVHGCHYTFKNLVTRHWNPDTDFLIQLGDFINKGPHSAKVLRYALKLISKYPYLVYFLRGNHEQMFLDSLRSGTFNLINRDTYQQIKIHPKLELNKVKNWLKNLPIKWENRDILITHAGVSRSATDPFNPFSESNVLINREPLRQLSNLQITGHVVQPLGKPTYIPRENAWHIDTGAYLGLGLSAVRVTYTGQLLEVITQETDPRDLTVQNIPGLTSATDSLKFF
ncbi:MAG: metallophosphoesterase family protein [Thermaurantimonas sp.]